MKTKFDPHLVRLSVIIAAGIASLLLLLIHSHTVGQPDRTATHSASPVPSMGVEQGAADWTVGARDTRAPVGPPAPGTREVVATSAPRRGAAFHFCATPDDAPAWAVGYGREFWRRPAAAHVKPKPGADALAMPASVNLGDVIERVSHAFEVQAYDPSPHVRTPTYSVSVSGNGLRFAPRWMLDEAVPSASTGAIGLNAEPAAAIQTLTVRHGNQDIYNAEKATPEWTILGNTAQALLDPVSGLVEHYETRSDGVEWTWVVTRPLPGNGPLVIEAGIAGLEYAGMTESGHHFADGSGIARMRISHARLADAADENWELPLESPLGDGRLRLTVPEQILAAATYPLAIDPLVEAEFGVDNPAIPAPGSQLNPSVAAVGSNYLVVWQQSAMYPVPSVVSAARMSSTGMLLDIHPLTIATNQVSSYGTGTPGVAANGDLFLVVWTDYASRIYGARVRPDGTISGTNRIPISTTWNYQTAPSLAASGNDFCVVWQDYRGNSVYGTIVTGGGGTPVTHGFPIVTNLVGQATPAVAGNGTNFLAVWVDARVPATGPDIYGARVSKLGQVLDTQAIRICTLSNYQFHPTVASLGGDYLVVWQDTLVSPRDENVYAARVSAEGSVLDPDGFPVSTNRYYQRLPAVASNGSEYLVAWWEQRPPGHNIYGARVSREGHVLDTNGIAIAIMPFTSPSVFPGIAASGSDFLVVWSDYRYGLRMGDIFGARVTGAGSAMDTNGILLSVSSSVNRESAPAVAFNGTNFLVVWEDYRHLTNTPPTPGVGVDIYGARLTTSGSVLDPSGFAISRATASQSFPAVAANGADFLVVWQDNRYGTNNSDIFGTLVRGNGLVVNTNGVPICAMAFDQRHPSVAARRYAYNYAEWLVVWEDCRNQTETNAGADIFGARVSSTGYVLTPGGFAISLATNDQRNPFVAGYLTGDPADYGGAPWLVVWQDYRSSLTDADVYGTWISASSPYPLAGIPIAVAPSNQTFPAAVVTKTGRDSLVVWADERNPSTDADIYGTFVSWPQVVVTASALPICTAFGAQRFPTAVLDGNVFLVAWEDYRNSPTAPDIFGARLTAGVSQRTSPLLDTNSFAINTNAFKQQLPAVAVGLSNQVLVVNEGFRYGTNRIVGNFVTVNFPPVAHTQSLSTSEDRPLAIMLTAEDADNDALTYLIVSRPAHGTLSGAAPHLTYRPLTNYHGPDSFTFRVTDRVATSAVATVNITVEPVNDPPVAIADVRPLFRTFTAPTNLIVLSPNNTNAAVVLDASASWDIEGDPLQFAWFIDGQPNAVGTSAVATNALAVGIHTIILVVSDGQAAATNRLTLEVITPGIAVLDLALHAAQSDLGTKNKQPLSATLDAAMGSFERGNMTAGLNQLGAFQNKVHAQIAPHNAGLARELTTAAQMIIDLLCAP